MSDLGISISAANAAAAYAAVRPIDPVRRRFPLADEAKQAPRDNARAALDGEAPSARTQAQPDKPARGAFGLVGALTSFFASLFSQADAATTATAAVASDAAQPMQAGAAAYARAAGATIIEDDSMQMLSPLFPRLSSGRALDLTV